MKFSTFIFFDTETTGLLRSNFHPRITELSMIAVNRFDLLNDINVPRVLNKLTLCFNPLSGIHPKAAEISGLNNQNLRLKKDFDENAIKQIELFLQRLNPPICIVAQNGYKFDFPLFQAELFRVKCQMFDFYDYKEDPIYCSDSLHLFKAFDKELIPKVSRTDESASEKGPHGRFSLSAIHERVFGSVHDNAHCAEADCIAVMKLVQTLGDSALSWFDSNHRKLSDIKTMYTMDESDPTPLSSEQFLQEFSLND
ncbi:hypothetical protein Aperf_G00000023458 [Anoplocephala perfoliata]